MALMKQSPLQPIVDAVQNQLEMCYMDLNKIYAFDDKLKDLEWLYKLWETRGLVTYNGVMYTLTDAGQFWQVNITQTTLECIQYLMTGKNAMVMERVAAQDSKKTASMVEAMKRMKAVSGTPSVEAMKKMAEAMRHMSQDEIQAIMKQMKNHS